MLRSCLTMSQPQAGDLMRSTGQVQPKPAPFLRRVYDLLDGQRAGVMVNVDCLANQLAVNRKTLYRNAMRLTRLSPADLIRQYYLHKAASLLYEGYTVAEAAYKVGFTTPSHFASIFKEQYGQTPSQFKSNSKMPPI